MRVARAQGSGIRIVKSVLPGTLSHSIVPWCCCTKVCASVSPRPAAAFPPRHQRIEDAVADRVGHARAVVLDMQFQCQPIALLAERDLARDARAQRDLRVAGRDALASACAALCAMLSTAWISCSRSPRNSGIEMS